MLNLINLTMSTTKKHKINLSSSSSASDSTESQSPQFHCTSKSWPRFISLTAENPFLIAKTLQAVAGTVKVKRIRDGSLLVECDNRHQAKNLLGIKHIDTTPVLSAPHRSLNSCRGIIRDRDRCLQSLSEDDIAAELASQSVSSVKRFSINKDGKTIQTNTYLLCFSTATLPSEIKAGYVNLRVNPRAICAALPANNMGMVHAHVKTLQPVAAAVPRNMTATVAAIHPTAATVKATICLHPSSALLG